MGVILQTFTKIHQSEVQIEETIHFKLDQIGFIAAVPIWLTNSPFREVLTRAAFCRMACAFEGFRSQGRPWLKRSVSWKWSSCWTGWFGRFGWALNKGSCWLILQRTGRWFILYNEMSPMELVFSPSYWFFECYHLISMRVKVFSHPLFPQTSICCWAIPQFWWTATRAL